MDKFDHWRKCWEKLLLGSTWDPNGVYEKKAVVSIETMADAELMPPNMKDNSICTYNTPFFQLHAMAVSYRTPGTKHYARLEYRNKILARLEALYETDYNCNCAPEIAENWWAVEIGIPLRLLNILVLLYDELPDREQCIKKYTDVVIHFKDQYRQSSHGKPETGANLMWKCQILLLVGILRREQVWIDWANEQIPTMLQYSSVRNIPHIGRLVDDGFYPDGSFVQHYMFAYTGGYGKNFIGMLAYLLYAFDGEECLTLSTENKEFIWKIIHEAYEPLIYNGRFMDIARGREPSRYYQQDYMTGRHVIRYIAYLCMVMPEPEKTRTTAMLKEWLAHNGTGENLLTDETPYAEHFLLPSMVEVLRKIDDSPVQARGELLAHYNFGPMCKTVHLGKGFAAAISMYNQSIACYERLGTESTKLWHFSDGVTYLYTADADQYNGDFYATADMQRLPGTTVDRSPTRCEDPYYSWYTPEARNVYAFAGGAMLGRYGIAGQQYRGQGIGTERSLEVKKSWFFMGDEIVCLGSGITSPTSDPIETTVDNKRITDPTHTVITVNGKKYPFAAQTTGTYAAKTLHITGNNGPASDIGYIFPNETEIMLACEHRIGTWNTVAVNPDNQKENDFAEFVIPHGVKPQKATYAYVILPCHSAESTALCAENPPYEIVENTESAHAVQYSGNMLGINFWNAEPYTCAGVTSNTQASVMATDTQISVCDATQSDAIIELAFDFAAEVPEENNAVEVLCASPLKVRVDTKGQNGGSVVFAVKRSE